uniref:Translin-associated factor X n=1 Tax=Cyprinus carpio TaxID=7962 RepID=A0A8C1PE29_CYPCA
MSVTHSLLCVHTSTVFQRELDTKHDKHERLVKISRDITIESKRTIFLLHRLDTNAEVGLTSSDRLVSSFYFLGIQEYVEAVSFHHFIRHRTLISLEEVNARLVFIRENKGEGEVTWAGPSVLTFQITPIDYLLGVADLTGELMRMCISSVGNGDIDTPFQLSGFLRQIHDGFSYIGNTGPYEVSKKLHTLRQSLGKVEDACYTLRVRGSEIPKHMLADVFTSRAATHLDPDEPMV